MGRAERSGRGRPGTLSGQSRNATPLPPLVPEVFQEMLADASPSSPTLLNEEGRSIKKRRVGGHVVIQGFASPSRTTSDSESRLDTASEHKAAPAKQDARTPQTAFNESDDSADSDMNWEEVDFKGKALTEDSMDESGELQLVLENNNQSAKTSITRRRRPVTSADRRLRLEIHRMHILALLAHVHLRNHWCNDIEVQKVLRRLLSKKTCSYLDDDENQSQFQRSRSFMDGLTQASETFRNRFKITARGMSRSYWADDAEALAQCQLPTDLDLPMYKADFCEVVTKLEGSRDIGAQLFCALLRSAGVDARLVCSLQPLPFTAATKGTTPLRAKPTMIVSFPDTRTGLSDADSGTEVGSDSSVRTSGSTGTNGATRRIRSKLAPKPGPTPYDLSSTPASTAPKKPRPRTIRESAYPVYWVEAFNAAVQKWIPIDPLVTRSIAKSSKLEPPTNDIENEMSYVIAFDDDGSARDVTRRYAKSYNAKTRKSRVEATKGGDRWWKQVLRLYKSTYPSDRDQVEDAELAAKEAAEGMPRNVQDFKNHPYYALERHLRRNEVIHPKREVGKVSATKMDHGNGVKSLEPIFRRRDVHIVKSADSWYRLGRELKPGEQTIKRVQRRRRPEPLGEDEEAEDSENTGTAMYAVFQTSPYQAPPVVNGRVPKNLYGNLDIYVPSMVPPGGVHLLHPDTARAAKLLGIDHSEAVVGFEFKGRHGTAVIKGAVIATIYREAVEEVIRGFEDERAEAEERRRTLEALRIWKKFLAGLRIRERIDGYDIEGEQDVASDDLQLGDEEIQEDDGGGGFLPDAEETVLAEPTARAFPWHHSSSEDQQYDFRERDQIEAQASHDGELTCETRPSDMRISDISSTGVGGGGFLHEESIHGKGPGHEHLSLDTSEVDRNATGPEVSTPTDLEGGTSAEALYERTNLIKEAPSAHYLVSDDEFEEAKVLQKLYGLKRPPNNDFNFSKNLERENDDSEPLTKTTEDAGLEKRSERLEGVQHGVTEPPAVGTNLDKSKDSSIEDSEPDKGSLLSYDPSDEDAEPEWLV